MTDSERHRTYWRRNQRLIAVLLTLWFLVSFVFALFLAEPLYDLRVGRLPMSFWWAHQGSMVVFVVLIFVYARRMDTLDRELASKDDRPVDEH